LQAALHQWVNKVASLNVASFINNQATSKVENWSNYRNEGRRWVL